MAYGGPAPIFVITRYQKGVIGHSSELGLTVVGPTLEWVLGGILSRFEARDPQDRPNGFYVVTEARSHYYRRVGTTDKWTQT